MATSTVGITGNNPLADVRYASGILGVPVVHLSNRTIPLATLQRIPETIARERRMVAYEEATLPSGRKVLRLAVADPASLKEEAPSVISDLHDKEGMLIEVALTSPDDLEAALKQYRRQAGQIDDQQSRQPVVKPVAGNLQPPQTKSQPLPTIDLTRRTIPKEVLERIPEESARKYRVVVFDVLDQGRTIHVAAEQPANPQVAELLSFIERQNNLKLVVYRASALSINAALAQYKIQKSNSETQKSEIKRLAEQGQRKKTPESRRSALDVHVKSKNQPKKIDHEETNKKPPLANQPTSLASKQPPLEIKPEDLATPELRIPPPMTESEGEKVQPLIPVSVDVERDMKALVGSDVTNVAALESIIKTGFIPKIVGALLVYAAHRDASDIHIQATGDRLVVRYRIDGILEDIVKMPVSLQAPIISRIKILARLKIDESRIPQDGRFDITIGEKTIDLRVSTFPTVYGEKVVMRLLDKSAGILKFSHLGLEGSRAERLETQIKKPYGVILATGPTGSGKSTLLYAILAEIATPAVNVVTLEDPVEYEIPGISQAQIQPKIGFGFTEGLRAILRQDPNIIMVGEIRDLETASMVTHAALTGHLVLSTLHTNDAAGALPRLINMGVEPFLITSAMNAIVAQRLVRRLCQRCRLPWKAPAEIETELRAKLTSGNQPELVAAAKGELKLWKAKGCDACHDGYKGRVGIFEVLVMSDAVEELAVKKAPASEIAAMAIKEGMVTMEQDGILKALAGITTLDEVLRVTKTE